MQASIVWRFFEKRIQLSDTIDTLLDEGYTIVQVIPTMYFQKEGSTNNTLSEAIIIVSK